MALPGQTFPKGSAAQSNLCGPGYSSACGERGWKPRARLAKAQSAARGDVLVRACAVATRRKAPRTRDVAAKTTSKRAPSSAHVHTWGTVATCAVSSVRECLGVHATRAAHTSARCVARKARQLQRPTARKGCIAAQAQFHLFPAAWCCRQKRSGCTPNVKARTAPRAAPDLKSRSAGAMAART